jgi:hypothetical protein
MEIEGQEQLLGFDARLEPIMARKLWSKSRRRKFIVGRYVTTPLSVDLMVWPSIFDHGIGLGMPTLERERLGLTGIPRPKWIGPSNFWDNADELLSLLAGVRLQDISYRVTAFTVVSPEQQEIPRLFGIGTKLPFACSWRCLGYDVASTDLVSTLAGYKFTLAELKTIKKQWASDINRHNLFDDKIKALDYSRQMKLLMPNETPFVSFGVYVLDTNSMPSF